MCLAFGTTLVGCDDGQEPQAPPASEDSVGATDESPQTSAPDDAAATSTGPGDVAARTSDSGLPEMPPEATEDSESGAEAFAEYYLKAVNYLGEFPQTGVLSDLASSDCSSCENFESAIADLERMNRKRTGPIGRVLEAQALSSDEGYEAVLRIEVPKYSVVDSEGQIVEEFAADSDIELRFELESISGGHVVNGVYLIEK